MRVKDSVKQESLYRATVQLVNEIGFASSSISKIARIARVSPATVYTYFDNKDDLLVSTYLTLMERMSAAFFSGLDPNLPVRDVLHMIWHNTFEYIAKNPADHLYTEQFSKSPFVQFLDVADLKRLYAPLAGTFRRGIEQKILKNVHFHMHYMFFFYPILTLAYPWCGHSISIENEIIETAFQFAWDAIKL